MNSSAGIFQDLLFKAVNEAREGVTIADAQQQDFPLVYVNEGFERLTGYACDEVIGKNYRILQGTDTGQPEIAVMLSAIAKGEGCVVTLRNYRKDGSMFWSELSISPLHNAQGTLTHFIGILKDMAARGQTGQQPETPADTDPLIGIGNRRHFDERFADLLHVAQRIHSGISVLMIDLDHFKLFNERYGRSAGDECLRMVGDCIAKSFIRASDCVARYGGEEFGVVCGEEFGVVSFSTGIEALRYHAQKLCEQVRALNIPHGDSPHGVVTVSIGGIHRLPNRDTTEELLIELANQELLSAKRSGRNRVHIIG
jgi:diguanylate cyclase (GGDEF)-like protein/PAS domain S-box-containing protein